MTGLILTLFFAMITMVIIYGMEVNKFIRQAMKKNLDSHN
jgi:hypothetical protein